MKNTLSAKLVKDKFFLIAEIGNNHGGNLNKAKKMIIAAKKSGAHAVKFQYTRPEGLISPNDKVRYDQLNKISLSFKQFEYLKNFSKKNKIEFFVSIFDVNQIHKFNKIQNIFKVASGDNNYQNLIKKIFKFKKSTIISSGMTDNKTFKELIDFINKNTSKKFFKKNLCIMHCVSSYPCEDNFLNLSFIENLKRYNFIPGYSDHSKGIDACVYAFVLGAKVLEKHFTLREEKKKSFRDHELSATPCEFSKLSKKLKQIVLMKGNGLKKIERGEKIELKKSRRSLFSKKDLKKGEILREDKLVFLRPGGGIAPNGFKYLGKKINISLKKNQKILKKYLT